MNWIKKISFCCFALERHSEFNCSIHASPDECPDVLVLWNKKWGPVLPIRDGGSNFVVIRYCPWCGAKISTD
jgi:hypothetical protein